MLQHILLLHFVITCFGYHVVNPTENRTENINDSKKEPVVVIPTNKSRHFDWETNNTIESSVLKQSPYPDRVDWRESHDVGPVKDQGKCAACWAFAVTSVIECHASIYLKSRVVLSEQFLIDCLKNSKGCGIMYPVDAFDAMIEQFGGILAEKDYYPYSEEKHECRWRTSGSYGQFSRAPVNVLVRHVVTIQALNEPAIALYVAYIGPVAAAINSASMAKYKGHYIDEPSDEECDPKGLNHVVTIVGYDRAYDDVRKKWISYWIIKNSWGKDFGDNGYYYLVRGRNACGISTSTLFPIVGKPH